MLGLAICACYFLPFAGFAEALLVLAPLPAGADGFDTGFLMAPMRVISEKSR